MITHPSPSSPFFVSSSSPPPTLLSFPTRRSSDLGVLVFAYSLGLGIPFVAGAMLLSRSTRALGFLRRQDRKSTRLNSSHVAISYAVFCLKKKTEQARELQSAVRASGASVRASA